jgi:endoglucanase
MLYGINIAGAEGSNPRAMRHNFDYKHPEISMINAWAAAGCMAIRYPFKWERLQTAPYEPLRISELNLIIERVEAITSQGMVCILDMHNYMRYRHEITVKLGETVSITLPVLAAADAWGKLAPYFASNPLVWFNLMNEPHGIDQAVIFDVQQGCINAIRAAGATNKVLLSVNNYSSLRTVADPANLATLAAYVDPANNKAVDLHQYVDSGLQGDDPSTIPYATAMSYPESATPALRSIGMQAWIGEFNAGNALSVSQQAIDIYTGYVSHFHANQDVYLGMSPWADGSFWSPTYHNRMTPSSVLWNIGLQIALQPPPAPALPETVYEDDSLYFNGTGDIDLTSVLSGIANSENTVLIEFSSEAPTLWQYLITGRGGNGMWGLQWNNAQSSSAMAMGVSSSNKAHQASLTMTADSNPHIIGLRRSAVGTQIFLDGVWSAAVSSGNQLLSVIKLGSSAANPSRNFKGTMHRVSVWNTALTNEQVAGW